VTTSSLRRSADRSETIARLEQSLSDVLYAVTITPGVWLFRVPADDANLRWLGSWSVAMNLAHLAVYEEQIAAPILEAIAAGYDGASAVESVLESDYEELWQALSSAPIDEIARRFSTARKRQIDAIAAMRDDRFNEPATTFWQDVLSQRGHSAAWVAAKTFQHTWEHGNSILRIALFAP